MALCSDELVSKDAMYHFSCYRDYTRDQYQKQDRYNYAICKFFLLELTSKPRIMIYKELTGAVEIEMRKNEDVTAEQIKNTKKNLRQQIEQSLHGYNFVTVQRQLYTYPDTLLIQNVVERIEQGKELDRYKKATFEEKHLFKAAEMIRNDDKSMCDNMPWPPSIKDLHISKMNIGLPLSFF